MDMREKLKILAMAAKYDVSCSSSGSNRKNQPGGIGNANVAGICHSFAADGRCISLLKVLMTNACVFDCAYCAIRRSADVPRATFTPRELSELCINFYRRNYIEGLFLSSAVIKNPDYTMERMIATMELLRGEYRFNGYIHAKIIPGADSALVSRAAQLADRVSVNIELPTQDSLKKLAPQKDKPGIVRPMKLISGAVRQSISDGRRYRHAPQFAPAGQTTQMIVGATPESDRVIITLSEALYKRYSLKRVYYSAYTAFNNSSLLPPVGTPPPLLREHRLYQADWLLRFYGFGASELLSEQQPDFDLLVDPKCGWALRNFHLFPVDVNTAPADMLLRVPGIGLRSAERILKARRMGSLDFEDLKRIGVVLKRARYFLLAGGRSYLALPSAPDLAYAAMTRGEASALPEHKWEQLSLFTMQDAVMSATGEL